MRAGLLWLLLAALLALLILLGPAVPSAPPVAGPRWAPYSLAGMWLTPTAAPQEEP